MKQSIDTILHDLYVIDPTLRTREPELRRVVETLILHTPHVVPDQAFVERLRATLIPKPTSSSIFTNFMTRLHTLSRPALAMSTVAAVAVLLSAGTIVYQRYNTSPFGTRSIAQLSAGAFGDLSGITVPSAESLSMRGMGGGGGIAASSANMAQPEADKRMAVDSLIYIPISYSYTYAGDPLTLPTGDLPVYRRVAATAGSLSNRSLAEMSRGLLDLSTFGNKTVETVTLHDGEYSINLDYNSGRASIYPYWQTWGNDVPQPVSSIPSDEELIGKANAFLRAHNINANDYGAPFVDQRWRQYQPLAVDQIQMPQSISVVYPFRFNDTIVHDVAGYPDGMRVNVDLAKNKVEGAWNIVAGSFEASQYTLETDVARIEKLAVQGGVVKPWEGQGAEKKTLKLGTPTVTYIYSPMGNDAQNREIYVPALQFPVLDRPTEPSGTYVPEAIIIPLVKDVLDKAEQQNNNPDRPVMMMKAQ